MKTIAQRPASGLALWFWVLSVLFTINTQNKKPDFQSDDCFRSNFDSSYREYEGSFKKDNFFVVRVRYQDGDLFLTPGFWSSAQNLKQVARDTFVSKGHEQLKMLFSRDAQNQVSAVELVGFGNEKGTYTRIPVGSHPVELVLSGKVQEAIQKLVQSKADENTMVFIGQQIVDRLPSKQAVGEKYLTELAKRFPVNAAIFTSLGNVNIALHNRARATEYYRKALALDASSAEPALYLKMLDALPYTEEEQKNSWKLPFSLEELFQRPSPEEMRSVEEQWAKRDLRVREVTEVKRDTMMLTGGKAVVIIVSHRVLGSRHYGAIIIPEGTQTGKAAALVELRGVSWNYSPLELETGLYAHRFLCEEAKNFVFIVPSFRGETIIFQGKEYTSEGDRTNSWDGATDDALALLNVALETIPEINKNNIAAFGRSRGGSVALLAGIRDKRIQKVVAWSAPVDWFQHMGLGGWTQQELIEAGLMMNVQPNQIGGQVIERFLKKNIEGYDGLTAARTRMIASSPLFFVRRLPELQAYYGIEDRSVPVANGDALERALQSAGERKKKFRVFFHPEAGHDTDESQSFKNSRAFLLETVN